MGWFSKTVYYNICCPSLAFVQTSLIVTVWLYISVSQLVYLNPHGLSEPAGAAEELQQSLKKRNANALLLPVNNV